MAPPKSKNPRTKVVNLRLTATEAADLDALATRLGLTRSEAVRHSLKRVIAAHAKKTQTTGGAP